MMNQMGGLVELVLVLAFILAFGLVELRSLRRDRKRAEEAPSRKGAAARMPNENETSR